MFQKIKKYRTLTKAEKQTHWLVLKWLLYGFILVRLVPLKWFSHLLGTFRKEEEENNSEKYLSEIREVKRAIKRIKKTLPWKVKCFEEAIAAKKALERMAIGSTLYLGVNKKDKEQLAAHAWLKKGTIFVTGKQGHEKYAVVGYYT